MSRRSRQKERYAMERQQLTPQQLIDALRADVERALAQVAEAVNAAPDGQVIRGSEHQVKDVMDALRARVFQQALQMKVDSAESTFSPGGPVKRATAGEQGTLRTLAGDDLRVDPAGAPALAEPGQRRCGGSRQRGSGHRRGVDQRGGQ